MQERLNVTIMFEASTPEGNPWHRTVLEYFDVPYATFVALEKVGVGALAELNKIGEEIVKQSKVK